MLFSTLLSKSLLMVSIRIDDALEVMVMSEEEFEEFEEDYEEEFEEEEWEEEYEEEEEY